MTDSRCPMAFRFLALILFALAAPARAGTVALTFDDLPVFGRYATADEGMAITTTLLDGLDRHRWRATGFVNEAQLDRPDPGGRERPRRIAMLERWLDAGMDLGNHTYSHPSLNTMPVERYIADVARDEGVTAPLLAARGRRERWFRYPFLETGTTHATRIRFEGWLHQHGYRVAPVTMENSDWQFAAPYDAALAAGDAKRAAAIRDAYIAFTARIVPWYRLAAKQLLGREPAFVFLLHASRLNAASIDALAAILRREHLRVVPLDTAMRDPAYRIADTYVGPDGNEWLTRWALTLHRDLPFETIPRVPHWIVADDLRVEATTDPHLKAKK